MAAAYPLFRTRHADLGNPQWLDFRAIALNRMRDVGYHAREAPKLDLPTLQQKMIADGRGGYCFEQNMLFRAGLRSLGFDITSLQGRVLRGLAIDAQRPAIHMLLKIRLPQGAYLADVGFGNLAPASALLLEPNVELDTPHEHMRFIDVGGELTLQARLKHG